MINSTSFKQILRKGGARMFSMIYARKFGTPADDVPSRSAPVDRS